MHSTECNFNFINVVNFKIFQSYFILLKDMTVPRTVNFG